MVPRHRSLISIGYKYDAREFLYFIVTEEVVSTKAGITYLSKYPFPFYCVAIHPVACSLIMYKFFGYVNEVESHKKSRQSDLTLEKF